MYSDIQQVKERSSQSKKSIKKIGNFHIYLDKEIGKGAFSQVYLAEHQKTQEIVACKEIPNSKLESQLGLKAQDTLQKELSLTQLLRHKNIVKFVQFMRTQKNNYIFLEYCGGGDMRSFLQERKRLSEIDAQRFMKQIADALKYLYQNNIIHRDLKLQNILLTEKSEKATLKLADFGLARRYQSEDLFETTCGTPIYMAPEIQRKETYDQKADLWSVGVILFELVAGVPPFMGRNREELKLNVEKGNYRFPPGVQVSKICLHLISQLLQSKSEDRIQWTDFFAHPFVAYDEKIFKQVLDEIMPQQNKIAQELPPPTYTAQKQNNNSLPTNQKQIDQNPKQNQQQIEVVKQNQQQQQNNEPIQQPKIELKQNSNGKLDNKKSNNRYGKNVLDFNDDDDDGFLNIKPQIDEEQKLQASKNQRLNTNQVNTIQTQYKPQSYSNQDQKQISESNDSLTKEDLDEAIDDTYHAIEYLFQRCFQALRVGQTEINGMEKINTFNQYLYEKQLKYLLFNLAMELRMFLIAFCSEEFLKDHNNEIYMKYAKKIKQMWDKYDSQDQNIEQNMESRHSLKIYQSQVREIKLTPYFLEKVYEKHGVKIIKMMQISMDKDIYVELLDFIIDIGYIIETIYPSQIGNEILSFAFNLCTEAAALRETDEISKAKQKYENAQFIIEELMREYTYSLDLSSDESQRHSNELIKLQPENHKQSSLNRNIRSFTFLKNQPKILISKESHKMMLSTQKMIEKRLQSLENKQKKLNLQNQQE
ncbi:protein kinase superfamily protein [Stylonychia lemnae]|uniref:Tpa: protein kinase superfamily protein n=1 Tax=Stylonychia lemnae TaxID=5949 RepID=A0A078AKF6_STYLE|nr:protein kinase superfamily protein [Stylonychia lemnae]|eukprot:CDW82865.1 protein kinase superfamily protein [Stylonychia lemnae]